MSKDIIYVTGESSVGKSHFLLRIGLRALKKGFLVYFLDSEQKLAMDRVKTSLASQDIAKDLLKKFRLTTCYLLYSIHKLIIYRVKNN